MVFYSTNKFRSGLKIIFDKEPYLIISNEFVKPGKCQSFNRVKLYNILSGKTLEKTFKSSDFLESADIIDINLIYLYNDNEFWYFLNKNNFEHFVVNSKSVGNAYKWLVEQTECILTLWNNLPITVTIPNFVDLKVIKTNPCLKGDTTTSSVKTVTLITGVAVKVPLFIQIGNIIKIDTRSGKYISRVK